MSSRIWVRLVLLAGLLSGLGFVLPGWTQAPGGKKYALLVGIRSYDHSKLTELKYTENDVEELGKVLNKAGYDEVVLLTTTRGEKTKNLQPTRANIRKELARLLKRVTRRDVVLIALAGHGVQYRVKANGREYDVSFFCPSDARPIDSSDYRKLAATMLPFRELFKALDDSGAGSRLLLIDACREEPARGRNVVTDALPRPAGGTAALFSCKPGERAFETKKLGKGHGVFFYHVIEGLKGAAKNEDGDITWDHLTVYVRGQVMRQVPKLIGGGATQTPHLLANVEGDPVLVRPGKAPVVKVKAAESIANSIGMKLVLIPAGEFTMGSPREEKDRHADEGPTHPVRISKAFYLGVHEVTQKQFRDVMGYNPSYFSADGKGKEGVKYGRYRPGGGKDKVKGMNTDDFPVENVSWEEAREFLTKLAARPEEKEKGRTYRLPTEAEWEYAARGGAAAAPFNIDGKPSSSLSSSQANFDGNYPYGGAKKGPYLRRTCKVGSYRPNAFALFDMHGNVWEWCNDWYGKEYYAKSPPGDPGGPDTGSERVLRGGSWGGSGARLCRAARRHRSAAEHRSFNVGFRIVAELPREQR
jgi:formylglycine-generating enzyme required for sulfatase activity